MKIIGLGTDITECARLEQILIKHEDNFLQMVYTEQEIAYCCGKKQKIQHLTGRWAAKEAVLKALGTGWIQGITWKDVEVRNAPSGKPSIVLSGGALDAAKRQGIDDILISISHCDSYAVASAVAFGRD